MTSTRNRSNGSKKFNRNIKIRTKNFAYDAYIGDDIAQVRNNLVLSEGQVISKSTKVFLVKVQEPLTDGAKEYEIILDKDQEFIDSRKKLK